MVEKERHFVLIHGAGHGAWCWYKLAPMLRSNGHRVTALDMAACGVNFKCLEELKSISDYAGPLMEFMADLPQDERVILVGHSLGGVVISLAMERFPKKIAVAVFLTAIMPGPRINLCTILQESRRKVSSFMDTQYIFNYGEDKPSTSRLFGSKFLAAMLYQLSPPEDLSLATLLVRATPIFDEEIFLKDAALSNENYGSVRRIYIVSDKDNVLKEDVQRWMIEKNPVDEVKLILDSDHMVMLCKPGELCSCLQEIYHKYI